MNKNFLFKFLIIKRWSNLVVLPLALVLLGFTIYKGGVGLILLTILLFGWVIFLNIIWFVPTGNRGFKRVFGKLKEKSYSDGLNWMIPVISETFLMDVMVQTKSIDDTKKVLSRNNIVLKANLTYQLVEKYAHIVFKKLGPNYFDVHVSKWVDACFDTMVSKLSYPHFQAKKADVEEWASKLVQWELAQKSSDITEELMTGSSFRVKSYVLVAENDMSGNPIMEKVMVGDGETEEVQKFHLEEMEVVLPGVNLFENVSLKINKVDFEKTYEDARANVIVRRAEVVETTLKAEKARIAAQGMKDADIIKAEGKAKEIELIESMKNAKAKELGDYMMKNPYMLKKILAENFPKVFGGANPVINLDEMLGTHPIS